MERSKIPGKVVRTAATLAAFLAFAGAAVASEGPAPVPAIRWRGPDGEPLPFRDAAEVAEFLRTARVISSQEIPTGITRPRKLLLERDGVRAHAVFRYGDDRKQELRRPGSGTARWVHDTYRNEVAAYELSLLLGMDNLPPAVERRIGGVPGSVELWIEGAMTEGDRRERDLEPPDYGRWNRQIADRRVFDELIGNADRNTGNTLIDGDWKLWLIDHTRAFGREKTLLDPDRVERCSAGLWQGLRSLDAGAVEERLPYLSKQRLRALLARRDRIVERLEDLIAERGERWVIFRYGEPAYGIEREVPPQAPV